MTDGPRIGLIWAQAEGGVIGRDGGMPWHVPEDLAHFKEVTLGSPVIMGRATWDSLDPRWRPLPGRRNIVITRQQDWVGIGAERAGSVDEALRLAASDEPEWIWIIGGGMVFADAIAGADRLEVTELIHPGGFAPAEHDVRAPRIDASAYVVAQSDPPDGAHTSRSGIRYRFVRRRRAHLAQRHPLSIRSLRAGRVRLGSGAWPPPR